MLIIGLNTDYSIKTLKGNDRPYTNQNDRAEILSTFDCIDYIVMFDENTPMKLIELIKPDVITKGGDYTPETVVGKKYIESYGGKIKIIPLQEGYSTTNLIKKVIGERK